MLKKNLFLILFGTVFFGDLHAGASLSFSPQRVVMTGHDRTATLSLTNRGDETGSYRISLSDVIYQNDGTIKHTTNPPAGFPTARPFVRFSPTQVRLAPGERQRIRVLLKSAKDIPDGEFRVHALLSSLPNVSTNVENSKEGNTLSAKLDLSESVAIPIIVQRGEVSSNAAISSAKTVGDGLQLVLSRSGLYSAYTNIEVFSGKKSVALVKGVAIPVPNQRRIIKFKLKDGAKNPPYHIVVKNNYTGDVFAEKTIH